MKRICHRLRGDRTPSTSASRIKNAFSSPAAQSGGSAFSPRGQQQNPLPFLPPCTPRYCIHSSRGPQRACRLTIHYGDVGLHFVLSVAITTVSITQEAERGSFPPARLPAPGITSSKGSPVPCPLSAGRREEGVAAGAPGAGMEGRGSREIDGPERRRHNEVIPPSRGSSIPRLRRGVPTARPPLRFAWAIAQVCGCHGDKRGLIKTQ